MGFVGDIASRPGLRRSKTAGRRQRDARLSIKNSINHALFIYRHPKRKVNARQRPIRGAFVYQRPTGEGLACQHPYAKGIFATSCAEHLLASILREALVTSTSYARCLQTHRTRSAGKRPVREVPQAPHMQGIRGTPPHSRNKPQRSGGGHPLARANRQGNGGCPPCRAGAPTAKPLVQILTVGRDDLLVPVEAPVSYTHLCGST